MKSSAKALLILLLFGSSIGFSMIPTVNAAWLSGWDYRTTITISGTVGAGTDYQIFLNVTYNANMQADFDDIRFTDDDETTLLDYWLQDYTASTFALFWVEVTDSLEVSGTVYLYYGNNAVSTTSDGDATFLFFDDFEWDNMSRWDVVGPDYSTVSDRVYSGSYSCFGDAGGAVADRRLQQNLTGYEGEDVLFHFAVNTQLETSKEYLYRSSNTSAGSAYPLVGEDDDWRYDNGPYLWWEAATYKDDTWFEVELALDFTQGYFWLWLDGVSKSGQNLEDIDGAALTAINDWQIIIDSGAGEDLWIDEVFVRNWVDGEPLAIIGDWVQIGTPVEFIFHVGWDPAFQFGFDAFFIFLGLIMIPVSTMYLVRGGRKEMSSEKLFYGLIIFAVGFGLLVGGIMP